MPSKPFNTQASSELQPLEQDPFEPRPNLSKPDPMKRFALAAFVGTISFPFLGIILMGLGFEMTGTNLTFFGEIALFIAGLINRKHQDLKIKRISQGILLAQACVLLLIGLCFAVVLSSISQLH